MEPITQEMRDTAFQLEQIADGYIRSGKGYRFVDAAKRENAKTLLLHFQQGYPSNEEFKDYKIGPRFTWQRLKHFAMKIVGYL
jgi:hypothetical protein